MHLFVGYMFDITRNKSCVFLVVMQSQLYKCINLIQHQNKINQVKELIGFIVSVIDFLAFLT